MLRYAALRLTVIIEGVCSMGLRWLLPFYNDGKRVHPSCLRCEVVRSIEF